LPTEISRMNDGTGLYLPVDRTWVVGGERMRDGIVRSSQKQGGRYWEMVWSNSSCEYHAWEFDAVDDLDAMAQRAYNRFVAAHDPQTFSEATSGRSQSNPGVLPNRFLLRDDEGQFVTGASSDSVVVRTWCQLQCADRESFRAIANLASYCGTDGADA
ncbi:MAG: hypothetical protein KDA54_07580, partial [Phycisphaerales bacterium]|nr:hypothetical protein [Phycisphaerales bacterium]